MRKENALKALGGTVSAACKELNVTPQAVRKWPDPLPPRIAERVLGVVALKHLPPDMLAELLSDEQPAEAGQGA